MPTSVRSNLASSSLVSQKNPQYKSIVYLLLNAFDDEIIQTRTELGCEGGGPPGWRRGAGAGAPRAPTQTPPACAPAIPRRARIQCSNTSVSLSSRLESNKTVEEVCVLALPLEHPQLAPLRRKVRLIKICEQCAFITHAKHTNIFKSCFFKARETQTCKKIQTQVKKTNTTAVRQGEKWNETLQNCEVVPRRAHI